MKKGSPTIPVPSHLRARYGALCVGGRLLADILGVERAEEIIDIAMSRSNNARPSAALYVPHGSKGLDLLASIVGQDDAEKLSRAIGGEIVSIWPTRAARHRRDLQVASALRAGLSPQQVGELFGICARQVANIAAALGVHLRHARRSHRRDVLARGRKVSAHRLAEKGMPAHVLRRAEACPLYRRALDEVAARHGVALPDGLERGASAVVDGTTSGPDSACVIA